jgi:hypothetical protein
MLIFSLYYGEINYLGMGVISYISLVQSLVIYFIFFLKKDFIVI